LLPILRRCLCQRLLTSRQLCKLQKQTMNRRQQQQLRLSLDQQHMMLLVLTCAPSFIHGL